MTFSDHQLPDETLLRAALEARAERVATSPDALVTIQARVRAGRRRRRGLLAGLSALATAAVAGGTAVALSAGPGVPVAPPVPTTVVGPTTGAPSPSTTPSVTATAPVVNEPVYLVGTVGDRDVLYREYHRVPGGGLTDVIAATVSDMIEGTPADPSYRTAWPAGVTVRGVQLTGDTVTIDLGGIAGTPTGPAIAIQQLVHTVTAVTAQAGRQNVNRVRITVDGVAVANLWGVGIAGPLTRGPAVDLLAPVWLDAPHEGAVLSRTFTVTMQGTTFEAAAVLLVRRADGGVVVQRPVLFDAGPPARGVASFELTLAPGTYTLEAFYRSAKDGSVQALDDHLVTVKD